MKNFKDKIKNLTIRKYYFNNVFIVITDQVTRGTVKLQFKLLKKLDIWNLKSFSKCQRTLIGSSKGAIYMGSPGD